MENRARECEFVDLKVRLKMNATSCPLNEGGSSVISRLYSQAIFPLGLFLKAWRAGSHQPGARLTHFDLFCESRG
jgi:hypothetical protein